MKASVKPGSVEVATDDNVNQAAVAVMAGEAEAVATVSPHGVAGTFEMPSEGGLAAFPLSIKYSVSNGVSDDIPDGALMIGRKDERYMLVKANQPVNVILLGSKFYARQWLSPEAYMNGETAKVYGSVEEAVKAGEVFARDPKGRQKTCGEACALTLLVERPDGIPNDGKFCVVIGGREYAPCEIRVEKSAFFDFKPNYMTKMVLVKSLKVTGADGKPVRPAAPFDLRMTLTVRRKDLGSGKGKIYFPALGNQTSENGTPLMLSAEEMDELRSIMSGNIREAEDPDSAE